MDDAHEIVSRAFDNLYGFSSLQEVEMQSTGGLPARSRIARQAGDLDKILGRSLPPASANGLLMIESPEHVYTTRVYIASLDRDRPFPWERHQSMPETDLWYEDFLPKRAKDWQATAMQEVERAGRKAWLIQLEPSGIPSAYERADYWFDQETPIVLAADFYREGEKVRTLEVDQDGVEEIEGHFLPMRSTFRGTSDTTLTVSNVEIREYEDSMFTVANLRRKNRP